MFAFAINPDICSSAVLVIALWTYCLKQHVSFNKFGRFIFILQLWSCMCTSHVYILDNSTFCTRSALQNYYRVSFTFISISYNILPCLFKRTVNTGWKHKYFKGKGLSEMAADSKSHESDINNGILFLSHRRMLPKSDWNVSWDDCIEPKFW